MTRHRQPGDQAPPYRKPFISTEKTATTHSKLSVEQATAGKMYRVRDRIVDGKGKVWGEDLTHAQATKLKEVVVASGKSRTARVEEMGGKTMVPVTPVTAASPPQPPPIPHDKPKDDPYLDEVRQRALRAAQQATRMAEDRHKRIGAAEKAAALTKSMAPAEAPDNDLFEDDDAVIEHPHDDHPKGTD